MVYWVLYNFYLIVLELFSAFYLYTRVYYCYQEFVDFDKKSFSYFLKTLSYYHIAHYMDFCCDYEIIIIIILVF